MINILAVMTITTDIEPAPGIDVPGHSELLSPPAPRGLVAGTEALLGSVARLSEVFKDEIVGLLFFLFSEWSTPGQRFRLRIMMVLTLALMLS